ncbi:flagellin [Clostridium tyrobutyricum]|uniref:Flagellin n=1 Tax=Clostridium tyrobutyricum DIVETGP TaxID=1408889 RepID=W6N8T9_CLOTY|nr:flagellin [Clostridium tyrobutyricum]AND85288.1 flagellin family protein [Clostridium tyrobutyricum]ANP69844.1 flagellin [Clostridium tyrobutyricum]MBV4419147.1 flagellin [Clostridium tyrobutyricum]MBV4424070.1 flagellin [Clostridium tyrobutyricum]MBV4426947.1 flagellin [Clostridium tyrobutyricum]
MRISYNMPALTMHLLQNQALNRQSGNSLRISSGYKVITAKDNPTALVQSENIRMQISGLQVASRNVQDGVSMLQTAEGGLQEITSMAQRIRQLSVQAGSGSVTDSDKQKIQGEIDQMIDGIDSIAKGTEFNGLKLLSQKNTLTMPVGANAGESVDIPQIDLSNSGDSSISSLYTIKSGGDNDILSGDIQDSLDTIDETINTIISTRSQYGALENRFESNYNNIQDLNEQMTSADSSIRDSDMGEEIMNYSKEDIIVQASNAMIAQANKLPQDILSILNNIK